MCAISGKTGANCNQPSNFVGVFALHAISAVSRVNWILKRHKMRVQVKSNQKVPSAAARCILCHACSGAVTSSYFSRLVGSHCRRQTLIGKPLKRCQINFCQSEVKKAPWWRRFLLSRSGWALRLSQGHFRSKKELPKIVAFEDADFIKVSSYICRAVNRSTRHFYVSCSFRW